ncbi:MAG TPA: TIGR03620 family F420-dependent LLM class oxidoreductase [Actinomycetota bacterium]
METDGRAAARALGRVGVWTFTLDANPAAAAREAVAELDELGYGAVWIPEGRGSKEVLSHAAVLLGASDRIPLATGIANIWFRDPAAMASGARTLADAFPGRFVLGVGVSHAPTVERRLGLAYERPYSRMVDYLDGMEAARYPAGGAGGAPPLVLAALGPRMLRLAAGRAAGAHPYFVSVEHTAQAREILGEAPLLAPEQAVVLETDPGRAREVARGYMGHYLKLPNYAGNLRRLGWSDDDVDGPSDALVDAIVAWGDEDAVVRRVREHLDAGADHVSVQVLLEDARAIPLDGYRRLAPALLD